MSDPRLSELALDGLWKNNPALVQVLGLCPLLAISNTTVNALGLAIARWSPCWSPTAWSP